MFLKVGLPLDALGDARKLFAVIDGKASVPLIVVVTPVLPIVTAEALLFPIEIVPAVAPDGTPASIVMFPEGADEPDAWPV